MTFNHTVPRKLFIGFELDDFAQVKANISVKSMFKAKAWC